MVEGEGEEAAASEDIETLRAERDELAHKVERMSTRRKWGGRMRSGVVGFLVVLTAISFLAAGVGVWASRNFLDNSVFESRLGTIAEEREVQDALARFTTAQIMELVQPEKLIKEALESVSGGNGPLPQQAELLAPVLASQVETFVGDHVQTFFRSDRFTELFSAAIVAAHQAAVALLEGHNSDLVQAGSDSVTLNFIPIINEILAKIGEVSPEIFGRSVDLPTITVDDVPEVARQKLSDALGVDIDDDFGTFTIYDEGKLTAAQDAVDVFNKVVWVLVILTVLLIPFTIWLSHRRRRTIMQLAVAIAVGAVLVRRLSLRLQGDILNLVKIPDNRSAVEITTDRVIDPLRTGGAITLWVCLAVLVIALLTGPYGWAVSLRQRVAGLGRTLFTAAKDRSQDEATIAWVREHRDALQWVGAGVGILALLILDLSWFGLLLLLALIVLYEVAIVRLTTEPEPESDPVES